MIEVIDCQPSRLERDRLAEENRALKARLHEVSGFDRIAAERLADEVAALVANRHLDSRSAAADALLDYRNPPRNERSDRIAALEAEVERLSRLLRDRDVAARQYAAALGAGATVGTVGPDTD